MSDIIINNNADIWQSDYNSALQRGLEAIGLVAEGYAKEDTPVDTGRLRNSITHTKDDKAAYIGTNVEYAPYVENGTRDRKGVYMLRKAATEHTEEYQKLMKESLENA